MARKKTLETSWRKWRQTSHIAIGIISQRHNVDATISHFFSEVVLGFDRNFIEIYFTMSCTSSNANESQNDSDINFIPGYIMEVEDEVKTSSSVAITNEDEWFIKPYEDEPIADENWMTTYNEQRRQEEDNLRLLKTRLEGQDKVDNW